MLEVDLGVKFVSANMAYIINIFWENSFASKAVSFKLNKLEWIGNSEISFLFSWIRALEDNEIRILVYTPSFEDILTTTPEYHRRKYCYERIVSQWRLQENISTTTTLIGSDFRDTRIMPSNFSQFLPLPIRPFDTSTFDQDFEALYSHYFSSFSKQLKQALQKTEITYYDSAFLDYSIIKELYSNVCLHAESQKSVECFYSVGVNKRFSGTSAYISNQRLEELSELESLFFQQDGKYRNIDFVEINFHDFGIGITESLTEKYLAESKKDLASFFGAHYKVHAKQILKNRILEYAVLLFTSRYELDRKLEVHDFIPRGLFILKEIAKKYNGYLEFVCHDAAISFNFTNGEKQINYGKNSEGEIKFPGTRIKVILPAMTPQIAKSGAAFEKITLPSKYTFRNISFLKELASCENQLKGLENTDDANEYKIKLTAVLFGNILSQFRHLEIHTVVLIDFAGIEPKSADYFNKFIYFITHFPLYGVNGLILYNLITKGLNSTVIFNDSNKLKSKGFSPYLIPCIYIDQSVEWLGVTQKEHGAIFTELWSGNTKNELINQDILYYNSSTLINIQSSNRTFQINVNLPTFFEVLAQIETEITNLIQEELDGNGIKFYLLQDEQKNYNDVVISKPGTCFLASNGRYLLKYISFNEKLYIYQYRRMLAAYFVFKLHGCINSSMKMKKINKILSVTLSSQLIGNEVREILNALYDINVELVALSNYYNFENEERFGDIKSKSKVIIVNDVISTGSLTNRIIKSIEIIGASPLGCLAIVDSRSSKPPSSDVPIIALGRLTIEDMDDPPRGYKVEVINPVLNVPTSMPKSKSRENVLMTRDEFLTIVDEKYLVVGNLRNKSVYFNYFLKTKNLLFDDSTAGFPVLNQLLKSLKFRKQNSISGELRSLSKGLEIVTKNISDSGLAKKIDKLRHEFDIINKKLSPELFDEYQVDVVFYPFLSDMSVVENDSTPFLESSLSKNTPQIYPIPRILTTRGWRFSFPPKFLNVLFKKNKLSVLIIDDGSLTGETIMQMIDSISFLSVKSIDVFSIFGRLEDFQKELLSRIKSIQVKDAVAPINIYFGTHFNIPVHNISESPFHVEIKEITQLQERLTNMNIELSDHFFNFLETRKQLLAQSYYPTSTQLGLNLFPQVSKKKLFIFRDYLGRFGSYKLYADDFPLEDHNFLIKDTSSILTLLTALNIEPQLYQTLKRIYSKEKIADVLANIKHIFLETKELLTESWMQEFYIKSLFYLNQNTFFYADNLLCLTKILDKHNQLGKTSFTYLEYLLILVKLNIKSIDNSFSYKSFETHIEEFILKLKSENADIFKEFRFVFQVYTEIQKRKVLDYSFPINKYYKLSQYYLQVLIHESKHDDRLLTNVFKDTNKAISVLLWAVEHGIQEDFNTNVSDLQEKLEKLKNDYQKYPEFKYIKDILSDFSKYANTDVDLDLLGIEEVLLKFENVFNNVSNYNTYPNILKLKENIDDYQNRILAVTGSFAQFIVKSQSHLMAEWNKAESEYLKKDDYVPIDSTKASDFILNVNPYALNLAFRNLLSNKYTYAKNVKWNIYTEEHDDYYEIFFKQNSKFLYDKGDGTGQHIIKTILNNYGILYKRISDNPYTLRISFEKS